MTRKVQLLFMVIPVLAGLSGYLLGKGEEPAIPTRLEQEQQMIAIAEKCRGEVTVFAGFEGELFSTKISCTEYKQFRD